MLNHDGSLSWSFNVGRPRRVSFYFWGVLEERDAVLKSERVLGRIIVCANLRLQSRACAQLSAKATCTGIAASRPGMTIAMISRHDIQ